MGWIGFDLPRVRLRDERVSERNAKSRRSAGMQAAVMRSLVGRSPRFGFLVGYCIFWLANSISTHPLHLEVETRGDGWKKIKGCYSQSLIRLFQQPNLMHRLHNPNHHSQIAQTQHPYQRNLLSLLICKFQMM